MVERTEKVKPSQVLTIYYAATFAIGTMLAILAGLFVNSNEIGMRGSALVTLSWNVLFLMILPLVLDWSERRHCKARFLELEEIAGRNPELAQAISDQCKKLSIPSLRLAVVEQQSIEVFSYGLLGYNPRLILSESLLASHEQAVIVPSIEAELTRFTSQDHTLVFFLFTVLQIILEMIIVWVF